MTRTYHVRLSASLASLPGDPDRTAGDFFLTPSWFRILAASGFDPAARPHLVCIEDAAGQALAWLPMATGGEAGRKLVALSSYYSPLFGPLGSEALPAQAWHEVARHWRRSHPRPPVIDLRPLDPASPFFAAIKAALRAAGYWTDSYFCFGNWYLDVAGRCFDEYQAGLPSALRNTIARRHRKLDRTGAWRIAITDGRDGTLPEAVADFEHVYARSWKEPEPFPRFIGALCAAAAAEGRLRLGVLHLGDAPVAAQLWLVAGGRAMIFKLAYDEAFKHLSAGSVLTAAMMRHAIDVDRVTEVDYLSGDDAYKRDWMSHRRERHGIVAFDTQTISGLIAGVLHFMPRVARAAVPLSRATDLRIARNRGPGP